MTHTPSDQSDVFAGGASRLLRDVLAAIIAVAFIGVMIFLAVMLTAVFLIVAGAMLVAGTAWWLWSKLRGKRTKADPEILVARRGPEGWTVDGLGS